MPHKLLLADDSVTIQRVIELTFADEDIQVVVAGDGRQAIERIQSERPDIVLADVGMPERDGYEVAAFVKGHPELSNIPVVLLTGAFETLDEERARSVGCDSVLSKPFDPQTVINRVRELLAGRRAQPVAPPSPEPPARAAGSRAGAQAQASPVGHDLESTLGQAGTPAERAAKKPGDSLEDYFDRLDAAFANLGAGPGANARLDTPADLGASLADLTSPAAADAPSPADPVSGWDPEIVGTVAPGRQPNLANAFAALLAAEQGGGDLERALAPPPAPVVLSDDAIEEIVRRVIARMGDDAMRRLVLDAAERLVREEIDRIKRTSVPAGPRPEA